MKQKILLLWALFIIPAFIFAQSNEINLSNLASFDGEPSLAVNPTNPDNIIAGWMRYRYFDQKLWIATRTSFDGGATWSNISFLPHIDTTYDSFDVSIAFNTNGVAFLSFVDLVVNDSAGTVFVTKSTDGGLTWGTPVTVFESTELPDIPIDRPWITIDNSGSIYDGTIYLTAMSYCHYSGGTHHLYLKTSTDNGNTWSTIKQVDDSSYGVGSLTISYGAVSVGANGKIYIAYYSYDTLVSPFLRTFVASTTDLGNSFQYNVIANVFITVSSNYTNGYSIAASPTDTGNVIMTWVDDRFGDADIVFSRSTDGGVNWSYPARLNDDATNNGIIQDRVWSYFSADGKYTAGWRDRRLNGTGSSVPADIYLIYSLDGGNSFSQNFRVSDTSATHAPLSCCNSFLGVTIDTNYAYAIWGDDRSSDWDIYFSKTPLQLTSLQELTDNGSGLSIYPNPIISNININFYLEKEQRVFLEIFDMGGKKQVTVFNKVLPQGNHTIKQNIDNISTGVYVCRLTGEQFILQKLIIIKN